MRKTKEKDGERPIPSSIMLSSDEMRRMQLAAKEFEIIEIEVVKWQFKHVTYRLIDIFQGYVSDLNGIGHYAEKDDFQIPKSSPSPGKVSATGPCKTHYYLLSSSVRTEQSSSAPS
jgi:hypothetical protein